MKAWIGINVRSNNQGLLNAVENALPNRLDNRLWDAGPNVVQRGVGLDEVEFVYACLFFNDFNERASFKSALGGINGFLHAALPGSYLKTSKCWHDETLPNGSPTISDELEDNEVIG